MWLGGFARQINAKFNPLLLQIKVIIIESGDEVFKNFPKKSKTF